MTIVLYKQFSGVFHEEEVLNEGRLEKARNPAGRA